MTRIKSLCNEGRGYAFPCNAKGNVDIDAMSTRARLNCFYATHPTHPPSALGAALGSLHHRDCFE